MQFRRSGQRDERRRKVLLDDTSAEAEKATPAPNNQAGKSDAIAKAYAKAAVEETETRVADLIPTRPLGVWVLFLLGLTAIAGVQALHTFVPNWSRVLGEEAAAAFDVTAPGSLNGWLSSLLFASAAVLSLLIYVIRRHKMDDYGGRYRMWLWTAMGMILLSVNAIAGLHRVADAVATHFAGRTLFQLVPGWSLMLFSFIGGIFVLRMLMDMWRSRGSSTAMIGAGLCYVGTALLIVLRPLPADTMLSNMSTALVLSLGHLLMSLSLLVYARRVLLEARGLIVVKKKQPKPKKEKKKKEPKAVAKSDDAEKDAAQSSQRQEKQSGKRKLKIDPAHTTSDQSTKQESPQKPAATISASDENSDEPPGEADKHGPAEGSPDWLKLSKAQRRRIKKNRRRAATAA